MNTPNTFGRSLQVFLLALCGLSFYARLILLSGLIVGLELPTHAHAQVVGGKGIWAPTGSLGAARTDHTATLLHDGRVLVVGGNSGIGSPYLLNFDTTELYDPATGKWTAAARLDNPLSGHTATLLANGKLLVAGGVQGHGPIDAATNAAQLYDPATGKWTPTGNLNVARWAHTAVLLQDGRVLVVGGFDSDVLASGELYDPTTGTWSLTGSLNLRRYAHTMTLLQDGKVLVAGGTYDDFLDAATASTELFDPVRGVWSAGGNLGEARSQHTATLLTDGRVLIAGGYLKTYPGGYASVVSLNEAELYDSQTSTWSVTNVLGDARASHTATLLPDGEVLVAGGLAWTGVYPGIGVTGLKSTELYDPNHASWNNVANLNTARNSHTATLLANGQVLVVGGFAADAGSPNAPLDSAELYTPAATIDATFTGSWFDPAQSGHGLMLEVLSDNRFLALWFAFTPDGSAQSWFGGVGTYSGDTATITDVALPTGGRWIPNFDPKAIVRNQWGTLTFTFTDHDHGRVDFNSVLGYGTGSMNLSRLTNVATQSAVDAPIGSPGAVTSDASGNTGATIGRGFSGSWFDPAQSGHGLMLEVLPDNRLLALWFAFNPEGNQQSWFGGVGTYDGNTATITDVALPTGGSWIPNFDPAKVVRNPWGTMKFTFSDCDHGRVEFNSIDGYGNGSMDLLRLTMPAGLSCP